MIRVVALVVAATLCHVLAPLGALAQVDCQFTLGFKALRDQIPDIVGDCLENEHFEPGAGSARQRTTGGLLSWRRADGWSTFTDGETIWIDGPDGLSTRPDARPQPAALPVARAGAPPPAPPRPPWWDVPTPRTPVQRTVPPQGFEALPPWAQVRARELERAALADGPPVTLPAAQPRVSFNGNGTTVTSSFRLNTGLALVHATHSGRSNFIVWLANSAGRVDLLVNEIGRYDARTITTVREGGDYLLSVQADGDWLVEIGEP